MNLEKAIDKLKKRDVILPKDIEKFESFMNQSGIKIEISFGVIKKDRFYTLWVLDESGYLKSVFKSTGKNVFCFMVGIMVGYKKNRLMNQSGKKEIPEKSHMKQTEDYFEVLNKHEKRNHS